MHYKSGSAKECSDYRTIVLIGTWVTQVNIML